MTEDEIFEKEKVVNIEVVEPEPAPEPAPKAKKPRKKRKPMTDDQRAAMLERLKKGREKSAAIRKAKREKKDDIKKSNKKTITKINSYDHEGANNQLLKRITKLESMLTENLNAYNKPKSQPSKILSSADLFKKPKQVTPPVAIPKPKPKPVGIDISTYKRRLW
tara:strand:+ start:2282 stop:2773 length:492 start_codon:yes stop_codon:yes gene_type:complete